MPKQTEAEIIKSEELASGIIRLTLKSEYISETALPGQFVNVRCCGNTEKLLRRPISVSDADLNSGTFDIVFMVKGEGTRYLADRKTGDFIDLLGPLGKPFMISGGNERILLVGGGIGVFPLLFLAKQCKEAHKNSLLGFRSREVSVLIEEFKNCSSTIGLCSDDGSLGTKGFVTALAEDELKKGKWDIIYACGPEQMLKKVAKLAEQNGTRCQLSLEQRMGCGIGACLVCSCKIKASTEKGWHYARVCKDGPVFWSDEVIWE